MCLATPPTIFNAWTEKHSLFRDARVEFLDWLAPEKGISTADVPYPNTGGCLLAAQSRFPAVTNGELFKNHWRELFEDVYGQTNEPDEELVTNNNIMKAIAAYQQSMNFTENP
ncbi:hypothetical protein PSECIP111854_00069 [Pseudoalteromonas sp. CIP111854]|uniref:Uncharacterized protein n=1 Tax=Pseudoalteromonas holothuriae TaxID=2963714 RepID=A0A9W4VL93_9GAMM|nr:hypothetical protein [Pseudoalteromonas sp. CIP111854]CAH9049436.1 hypothetical protein PSECIP111854_00069 [Pseudoalteromonas sp. CIP111854]